ncbi:MAG: SPOR domain-containing protein [Novosphingobium sp.]|nr:SPOR domain-containing protein [Novosphingobium sp.]
MNRNAHRARMIGLTVASVLAATALTGCTMAGGPHANVAASRAETAMKKGHTDKAVDLAEQAVMSEPGNAGYRAILGTAYLNAGRFQSAATSFDDAMALGDTSPRTALSLALAEVGAGHQRDAVAVLDDWRDQINGADLGLAYALAGEAERGVKVLADALRGGENTPKVRQNLAYAYALAGEWRQARLMAAQDVPADQLDQRISQWALSMRPDAYQQRVAGLLDVSVPETDPGQPAALALNGAADGQHPVAAAAPAASSHATATEELPALAQNDRQPAMPEVALARYDAPAAGEPNHFEAAFAAEAPKGATPAALIADTVRYVTKPVVQNLPANYGIAATPKTVPAPGLALTVKDGDHLVQLGSFFSEQSARQASAVYAKRHPGLDGHRLEITQAVVNSKHYWRVSAAGFDKAGARAMCANVQAGGHGCIPYAKGKPLPGAIPG